LHIYAKNPDLRAPAIAEAKGPLGPVPGKAGARIQSSYAKQKPATKYPPWTAGDCFIFHSKYIFNLLALKGEVSCKRYISYEVRSVRKLFNGEGLLGKPVYYHLFVSVANI
jgi:hypothetical protein